MLDVATTMVNLLAARNQGLVNIAIMKKQHEMQTDLINMLTEVAKSAPPPGQGSRVDRTA